MNFTLKELTNLTYAQHAKLTEIRHYALELMKELQQLNDLSTAWKITGTTDRYINEGALHLAKLLLGVKE